MVLLQWVLTALCLVGAAWVSFLVARDRRPGTFVDVIAALVEAGLVVLLVLGLLHLRDPHAHASVATWVGYLVGMLLVVPAAWLWAQAEPSRGGTAVLVVGFLVVPFLFLRLGQVWAGG